MAGLLVPALYGLGTACLAILLLMGALGAWTVMKQWAQQQVMTNRHLAEIERERRIQARLARLTEGSHRMRDDEP